MMDVLFAVPQAVGQVCLEHLGVGSVAPSPRPLDSPVLVLAHVVDDVVAVVLADRVRQDLVDAVLSATSRRSICAICLMLARVVWVGGLVAVLVLLITWMP